MVSVKQVQHFGLSSYIDITLNFIYKYIGIYLFYISILMSIYTLNTMIYVSSNLNKYNTN